MWKFCLLWFLNPFLRGTESKAAYREVTGVSYMLKNNWKEVPPPPLQYRGRYQVETSKTLWNWLSVSAQIRYTILAPESMLARSQALLLIHSALAGTQHDIYSATRWERLLAVLQATCVVRTLLTTGTLWRCRKFRFTSLRGPMQSSCLYCKVRGLTTKIFKSLVL